MAACEVCWDQAYVNSRLRGGSQAEHYQRLIAEQEENPTHTPVTLDDLNGSAEAVESQFRGGAF